MFSVCVCVYGEGGLSVKRERGRRREMDEFGEGSRRRGNKSKVKRRVLIASLKWGGI